MKRPHERSYAIATLLTAAFLAAQPLSADELRIRVPVPPIPKIVLPAPPPMVWLPGPRVYVAHDSPHEIFYSDGQYYFTHGSVWYVGPAYNGPWRVIHTHYLPRGLRGYRHEHWGRYQSEVAHHFRDKHFRHERHPFYAGHPHKRAHWKDEHHDRGLHRRHEKPGKKEKKEKHGRGRGHGKD